MNENELYLIQEEDYLRHIDEKLELYAMLCQLIQTIRRQPACPPNAIAHYTAEIYAQKCEQLFKSWGIPESYLVTGDTDELIELMENELITPEDAGFYPNDGYVPEVYEYEDDDYDTQKIRELLGVSKSILSAAERLTAVLEDEMDCDD